MGLKYSECERNFFVVARDKKAGRVLIGGLGVFGVGQMWFDEQDYDNETPGYNEAKDVSERGYNIFKG